MSQLVNKHLNICVTQKGQICEQGIYMASFIGICISGILLQMFRGGGAFFLGSI